MIPKKIHYCWFGGIPLPQDALMCIESWKKYFPDYEIIEWNEKNFDMNSCDYIREAAENKKWAFVSDFARFKILYDFGGIYFDTDVEVVRFFDEIIAMGAFMGKEVWNVLLYTCIFAGGLAVGKLAVILAKRRKMPFLSEAERTEGVRMHMSVPILLGYIAYVTGGVSIGI